MERVVGVLDKAVSKSGWLVGHKCTFADLSFVTWARVAHGLFKELGKEGYLENFPSYEKWLDNMMSRDAVQKNLDRMAAGRAAHNLP